MKICIKVWYLDKLRVKINTDYRQVRVHMLRTAVLQLAAWWR